MRPLFECVRQRRWGRLAAVSALPLAAAMALAASRVSSGSGTGSSASGMPMAVLAMTSASRSSVFASPANSFAAWWAAIPGR